MNQLITFKNEFILEFNFFLPQPLSFVKFDVLIDCKEEKEEHIGMIFNPYSRKWSFL